MGTPRLPLFQRLPEIYRIRDTEQVPPGQLEAYVGLIDRVQTALHDDIAALYLDFFIETCNPWVIPYIADLVGTSHLAGAPHDLRADVARTVRNRRRKGTLGAVESVVYSLSGWAVHAVEMRERLLWAQHLNHQRPDAGGVPPLSLVTDIAAATRGGSVTLRDPALLSLLGGPFEPFAHSVDLKPPDAAYNLPDLAIFLWRLKSYRVPVSLPSFRAIDNIPPQPGFASFAACFVLHPMGEPMVLFNSHHFDADADPPLLTSADAVPGPMPAARLTSNRPAGRPESYVRVETYDETTAPKRPADPGSDDVGLVLHLPKAFVGVNWMFRGANLCAWETGLRPALSEYEIAIDPDRGRIAFGTKTNAEAVALRDHLLVSASYGFAGPTGAHPVSRPASPTSWHDVTADVAVVDFHDPTLTLENALKNLPDRTAPLIIEIKDSMTHDLDLTAVVGIGDESGKKFLQLSHSLWIRGVGGQRPVIRLKQPLAFAPHDLSPGAANQGALSSLAVRLEGLYLTRGQGFPAGAALIERAALNQLDVTGCTLDPGGFVQVDGSRAPLWSAMRLGDDFGYPNPATSGFDQTPDIRVERSIVGTLAIGTSYTLTLSGSIVDAGTGVGETPGAFAVCAPTATPATDWGPELIVDGMICFGRMRVTRATGAGGIWTGRIEAHDNQAGCIRFSCFSGDNDRIPPNHGCVFATSAPLRFTSEAFGGAGYAQLTTCTDLHIREQGPADDEMGAFGYLLESHKWKNVGIRLREYTPIGVRPILIPVT